MARPAGRVWPLEHGLQAVSRLGQGRCFQPTFRRRLGRSGHGVRDGRRDYRQVHRHGQGAIGELKIRPSAQVQGRHEDPAAPRTGQPGRERKARYRVMKVHGLHPLKKREAASFISRAGCGRRRYFALPSPLSGLIEPENVLSDN
jgi:hypothetical protein